MTPDQFETLAELIAKERACLGELYGERFEALLADVCDNASLHDRKDWFDVLHDGSPPLYGIEAKTFQVDTDRITPGVDVTNVLKRVPAHILPSSTPRQTCSPSEAGAHLLEYLTQEMQQEASRLGIPPTGRQFGVLLRTPDLSHIGYWEEPIAFNDPSTYTWEWTDSGLVATRRGKRIIAWYTDQRQVTYRFTAPSDILTAHVPHLDAHILSETELHDLLISAVTSEEIPESTDLDFQQWLHDHLSTASADTQATVTDYL